MLNCFKTSAILFDCRPCNPILSVQPNRMLYIKGIFISVFLLSSLFSSVAQNGLNDLNFKAESEFQPTIKDAVKFSYLPEIKDTVKHIHNIQYGINSTPIFPKYQITPIHPAKMQNEPLTKLYHTLIKAGYGPIYGMPYAELWYNSTRSREVAFGAHYKHFSSNTHLENYGYGGFSDHEAEIFAKKFYKKHTLGGEFNYKNNMVHFYGFDTVINKITDKNFTKQTFQLFEPKLQLQSHYTDSSKINHNIQLSYYNFQDLYNFTNAYYAGENNVKLNTHLSTFIKKENLHLNVLADYYSHDGPKDTVNDFILSLNPYFEANGKKWHADIGLGATMDIFGKSTKFYFYPQLNIHYNVYENMIIPYVGISGGLTKNSFRSLSGENPFIDPALHYANTNNQYKVFGGLRGNLSSNTSYDANVSYGQYDSLHYFIIDYSDASQLYNKFKVIYDNTSLLKVSGQVKYQYKEKIHFIAKGNYYLYTPKNLTQAYHKPNFDLTFSAIYNLRSKIVIKGDVFVIGDQWALTQVKDNNTYVMQPKLLNSMVDVNLGVEYRYSKMLSIFIAFNNIANLRYYRWERYPTQRFNMMIGLTFVPF